METYRDHPLAFLCARPSVDGLRWRGDSWKRRGHEFGDIDVSTLFARCANTLMFTRQRFRGLLDMIEDQAHIEVIAQASRNIDVDLKLAEEAFEVGQGLRDQMMDPYGGSTSASLEMFCDEMVHLSHCVESVIALADSVQSYDALETVILDALDEGPQPEVTHDAPRGLM